MPLKLRGALKHAKTVPFQSLLSKFILRLFISTVESRERTYIQQIKTTPKKANFLMNWTKYLSLELNVNVSINMLRFAFRKKAILLKKSLRFDRIISGPRGAEARPLPARHGQTKT